jgi:hypothetical protein
MWLHEAFGIDLNQRHVDFVIPRLDQDLPLCIDPFLLYKSRREDLQTAHKTLLSLFQEAFAAFRSGKMDLVSSLIDFPEVPEIRFGYASKSISGRGIGQILSKLVIETLGNSPLLIERGIRHVEELQLFSVGIAEDRVSDMAANIIKYFLAQYTTNQCKLWGVPTTNGVPLHHIWDAQERRWVDQYVDIPVDQSGRGILFVPRWIVRRLPWINYDDFLRTDLTAFLRGRLVGNRKKQVLPKSQAVEITRANLLLIDSYVSRKEREAPHAQPDPPPLLALSQDDCSGLLNSLSSLPVGHGSAYAYQRLLLQLFNCLLEPELVDGEEQVRTSSGVEIRDLVYSNNSDLPFFNYLLNTYGNLLLVFECKNVEALDGDDINQLANYLGDPMGRFGILVTRKAPSDRILAKARATYNKQHPRKGIVILHDEDLGIMVGMKKAGSRHPAAHLQRKYREFVQSIE